MTGRTVHAVGDRVIITGRDHPCFDEIGRIIRTFDRAGLEWVVELETWDPGRQVAVHSSEIRKLP